MRRWTNEVVVGAMILIAIAIGIYGYIFLRDIPVRQHGFEINIIFNNVTGLEKNDAITVGGYKVGRILDMRLEQGHVIVRAWLNGQTPFSRDSRCAIRSIGMIGEKYIDLMPGSSPELLQEDDTIVGEYISDLADAGGGMNDIMAETRALLQRLNAAMDSAFDRSAQRAISATLINMESISNKINANLDKDRRHLSNTIARFDSISRELRAFWQTNNASVDSIINNVNAGTANLPVIIAKLDSAVTTAQKLLAMVENRQGAVGKAIHDAELYDKFNHTLEEANRLLEDINKNPSKYLQFSVFRF
ncbi:MAG: MlaD family protein [candidate division KSB1 bacterium]|nr:MlaD family protein [candidate division KSB1 bacterium]MDZ7274491.1 MlaD family protein [candidate division KSB1 bacterium]MDZ7284847.1 MlaD family protein [candidate division KSB1 bacterium]MDZ7297733.1 MlaD family protein [candidate division KSB1 bacterium]MDZ7307592.1 MlaD family protein [candidate division KSB1 bacterium]